MGLKGLLEDSCSNIWSFSYCYERALLQCVCFCVFIKGIPDQCFQSVQPWSWKKTKDTQYI